MSWFFRKWVGPVDGTFAVSETKIIPIGAEDRATMVAPDLTKPRNNDFKKAA